MLLEDISRDFSIEDMQNQLERFRKLAQISSDWFWETDVDYIITYMSDSVKRITGFPKEKYIGVSRYELASDETKHTPEWKQHIGLVAKQKPIKNFEYRHIGTDGHSVYLRVNAIPLFHHDGTFRGYLGTTTDITELILANIQAEDLSVKLQKSLDEFKTLKAVLPICSYCKKIRDDENSWEEMESYISAHVDTEFSHSICPECYRKVRTEMGLDEK